MQPAESVSRTDAGRELHADGTAQLNACMILAAFCARR